MGEIYTNAGFCRKDMKEFNEKTRARIKEDKIRLLESNMLDEIRYQYIYKIERKIKVPFEDGKRESFFPYPAMKVNEKVKVDAVNHIYEGMVKHLSEVIYEAAKDFYEAVEDSEYDNIMRFENRVEKIF